MLLSAQPLKDVANVNSFEATDSISFTKGDSLVAYFRLVNADLDLTSEGFSPPGRRYVPAVGATLQVKLESIDDSKTISRIATQPFVGDASIWAVSILSTDTIQGTIQLRLTLTEGSTVTRGVLRNAFRVSGANALCD